MAVCACVSAFKAITFKQHLMLKYFGANELGTTKLLAPMLDNGRAYHV